MDKTDIIKEIAAAKAQDRLERAKRPYVDKVRAVIRMRKRYAVIAKLRGKTARVWDVDL